MGRKAGAIGFWRAEALVAALLFGAAAQAWAGLPTFNTVTLGYGQGPAAEVTADFNGDGKADLAVANKDNNTITIFRNTGSGLPLAPQVTLTGTSTYKLDSPRGIVAGRFRGPTSPIDLAVTNYSGASVSIFLGNGDGTFTGPTNYPTNTKPLGIATAQLHKSTTQNLDLVVVVNSTSSSGKLQILSGHVLNGHGDGTFTAGTPIGPIGSLPQQVAVGDFLKPGSPPPALDGFPDVAVTLKGEYNVAVLWGDGNGNLAGLAKYPSDRGGRGIVAAHLTSATYLDLATADHYGYGVNKIDLLPANPTSGGFGNYNIAVDLGTYSNPNLLTAVNFSQHADGLTDLAVTDTGGSGTTHDKLVLLRNAAGSLTQFSQCSADDGPTPVVTADFNADSCPDFAVGNSVSDDISIIIGNCVNGYHCSAPTQIGQQSGKKPVSVALCDVTNPSATGIPDGILDLIVLDQKTGNIVIFGNDGNGSFVMAQQPVGPPSGWNTPWSVACAGHQTGTQFLASYQDFAVTYKGSNQAVLYCNQGNTSFHTHATDSNCPTINALDINAPQQIIYADWQGTGQLGPAWVNYGDNSVGPWGMGTDPQPMSLGSLKLFSSPYDIAVACKDYGSVYLLQNNGSGTFTPPTLRSLGLGTQHPYWVVRSDPSVAPCDLDGLYGDDIITANQGSDKVSVLLNLSGGLFSAHTEYAAGNGPNSAVVGDFDVDSKLDVAVAALYSDSIAILPGDPTNPGTLTPCPNNSTTGCLYPVGDGPVSIAVGNLNQDAYPDLVVVNENSTDITVLLNAYTPPTPTPTVCATCPTPTPRSSGGC